VCPAAVEALGAARAWEAAALACLWIAAKHEEVRRGLPPASRLAPLAGCSVRTLAAVELHVLGLLRWAPLAGWAPHAPRGRKRSAGAPAGAADGRAGRPAPLQPRWSAV